jgi:activator of HSP90 ATPase
MIAFEIEKKFATSAEELYDAWLDSESHSQMTGGEAHCSNLMGSEFSAWDGYISGHNLQLREPSFIKQAWRTTEFGAQDKDSIIEISLIEEKDGCRFILKHSQIPEGQPDYEEGWVDNYFEPMEEFFGKE